MRVSSRNPPSLSPRPASRLSGYSIREKLGSGSFGVIFRGTRIRDSLSCVIKEVDMQGLSKSKRAEAIKEGEILG